jgi:alpha-L-fucosidase
MDLIDTFHPNQFYVDFSVPFTDTPYGDAVWRRLQAHYYNASLKWNGGRMMVGTNIKNIGDKDMIRRSCIEDFEGGKEGDIPLPLPWQHDDSVNQEWFYDGNSPRRSTKSPAQVVRMLVDTVSRNGNLLLNVGLRADGTVPPEEQDVLKGLAEFIGTNGEAIHGSRPWKISTDRASDVFFTTKGEALYALVLRWPEGGKLELPALAEGKSPWLASVQRVSLPGSDSKIKWMRTVEGMSFELPREKQANFLGLGLKLEGRGSPV